jgi:release factor glutamine methyltransferase
MLSRLNLRKKILNKLHPVLKPLSQWYLSKPRTYRYNGILVKIYPGVFHPGLFFSTKILLEYLKEQPMQGLKVLELGAGSGLISIYCAKRGALVTASDIGKTSTEHLHENAMINGVQLNIVLSDLFAYLNPSDYDWIIINPPYYPKDPQSEQDFAWFCGKDFGYFSKLFYQLSHNTTPLSNTIMVLSEDCDLNHIQALARSHGLLLKLIFNKAFAGENNYIFRITAE